VLIKGTKDTRVRGRQKPEEQPTSATRVNVKEPIRRQMHLSSSFEPSFSLQDFLDSMRPTDVFACENGTLFFHQDEDFFLAIGVMLCRCLDLHMDLALGGLWFGLTVDFAFI